MSTYICTHNRSPIKSNKLEVRARSFPGVLDGHVADGHKLLGHLNLEVKRRLQIRFIEAGEGLSGVTGLKLSAQHKIIITFRGCSGSRRGRALIFGPTETGHVIVDGPREFDIEKGIPGLNVLWEFQDHSLRDFVVRNVGCFAGFGA